MADKKQIDGIDAFTAALLSGLLFGKGTGPKVHVFSDSDPASAATLEKMLNNPFKNPAAKATADEIDKFIADRMFKTTFTKSTTPEPGISGTTASEAYFDDIGPRTQTFGEKIIGFHPATLYPHVESETLQDFADVIDVVNASRGQPGSESDKAAQKAIEAIEVANFWTQKALSLSNI